MLLKIVPGMKRFLGCATIVLAIAQIAVIILSWMIAAARPEAAIRSLLSSEGIRWFFGGFADNLTNTFLIWAILLAVAGGVCYKSNLWRVLANIVLHVKSFSVGRLHYRERVGLVVVFAITVIAIVVVSLLTMVPHAILLSILGTLFPSSFSASIVPIISFYVLIVSLAYGYVTKVFSSMDQMYDALVYGVRRLSILFPLYIIGSQVVASIGFVMGWV